MKIHIYTDIEVLFGRACRVWMKVLLAAGHEVEYIDLGMENTSPLPDLGPCDVNLLVAGIYAFSRFNTWGLPSHGKNVLWMFDPLTRNPESAMHGPKSVLFDALASQLDAVIAMDASIESYLHAHHPKLATCRIPYLISEQHIEVPQAESARSADVILLGGKSPHRERAQALFEASAVRAEFLWSGVWGAERDARRRNARISLNIHAESKHTYFDQFRALDTWAAGTVVLTETSAGLAAFGIEPGIHLAMAELEDFPDVCAALLSDVEKRQRMVRASQALLREQFSARRWEKDMLAVLQNLS